MTAASIAAFNKQFKYFNAAEFDSPDAPGSGLGMDLAFVGKLDRLRAYITTAMTQYPEGPSLIVNSGFRTPAHNAKVGGVANSAHLKGHAADIKCETDTKRYYIMRTAYDIGFARIGAAVGFIHFDDSASLPQNVFFLYPQAA